MKPDQLSLITTLSRPTLSPDGSRIVVAASAPSFDGDTYVGQLWSIDSKDREEPRRITLGIADTAPAFSPDGAQLAFLRKVDGAAQLAIVDARGAEARVITSAPLGVVSFRWDRASRRIAYVAPMPEEGRYGTHEGVAATAEPPRRITTNKYQLNGRGYLCDKPLGVYLIDVPALDEPVPVRPAGRGKYANGQLAGVACDEGMLLTPPGTDATDPEFSPDGQWLYFTAALHQEADEDLRSSIYRVRVDGSANGRGLAKRAKNSQTAPPQESTEPGKARLGAGEQLQEPAQEGPELVAGGGRVSYGGARFSGGHLFLLGTDVGEGGRDFVGKNAGVYVLAERPRLLTDTEKYSYGESFSGPLEPHGSGSVLAIAGYRGSGQLHSIASDGTVQVVSKGKRVVTGAASAGKTIVVTYTDPTTPGEVAVVGRGSRSAGVIHTRTTFGAALAKETRIVAPHEVTFKVPVGNTPGGKAPGSKAAGTRASSGKVHGWVFLPEGAGPHPVLLNIHGGPFSAYTWSYFDEAQVYTQAGYAVLMCNPRGSATYGHSHGRAVRHQLGTVDMQDVLAFAKGAVRRFGLDSKRMGILGGSYGGYLTAWTIAHTDIFRAALVERGYLDPGAFPGTSDIGWFFSEEYVGTDPKMVASQSPMDKVRKVTTPALIMHSEQDLRCPLGQAQRYWAALKSRGVPTELVVFPGENHELSRSGTPFHRRERFDIILEWFSRYLMPKRTGGKA